MTDSLLDAAERKAHEAADGIERGCWCKKSIGYVCPAHESQETAHAAIRDLRREAFRAGERAMRERAAKRVEFSYWPPDGNDAAAAIRALAEDADDD